MLPLYSISILSGNLDGIKLKNGLGFICQVKDITKTPYRYFICALLQIKQAICSTVLLTKNNYYQFVFCSHEIDKYSHDSGYPNHVDKALLANIEMECQNWPETSYLLYVICL